MFHLYDSRFVIVWVSENILLPIICFILIVMLDGCYHYSVLEGKMFPVQIRERVLILDLCKQVDQLL